MDDRLITATRVDEDAQYEAGVRPRALDEYIGQDRVRENLQVSITAARQRQEALDHVLLYGPPGLGKTTLAYVIAHELGAQVKATSGPVLEKPGDLAGMLTDLGEREVLFIDEIHRMPATIEEILYPALEDYELDIMIGQGPGARSVKVPLQKFTLIGATTRAGLLTSPLRSRFCIVHRLEVYTVVDLEEIVRPSARSRRDAARLRLLRPGRAGEGFTTVVAQGPRPFQRGAHCGGRSATITARATYAPPRLLTNHDLEKLVDTTDEWILQRTGIRERHIVEPGGAPSDLAKEGAAA